jgi:predicted nucleic-acid-binding protein
MIAVDTNILVRYFIADDPAQAALARDLFESVTGPENPAFVSLVTLVELIWVLNDAYKIGREAQATVVRELLEAGSVVVEEDRRVAEALDLGQGDIADRIIHLTGRAYGCTRTLTFDRKFARLDGVELLR